jgi:FlaA1/EpsC-like NDP-sugar epimerase
LKIIKNISRIGLPKSAWKPGRMRVPILLAAYSIVFILASFSALALRFDWDVPPEFLRRWWHSIGWVLVLKLGLLGLFGQFRSLLTFFSFPDAKRIFFTLALAALIQSFFWFATAGEAMIPRGVIVVDFILSFFGVAVLRSGMRLFRERFLSRTSPLAVRKRVAIIGAGEFGASLARDIQAKPGLGMEAVCFIDDDPSKIGLCLHGLQVFGDRLTMPELLKRLEISKCILAMPQAHPSVIAETVALLNEAGIDHDILPSVDCILNRGVTVNHLRRVSPEDLLGRAPVCLDEDAITHLLQDQVVLVTGAGGSIGRELCLQIAAHAPLKLVLLERAEPALFDIEQEILREFPSLHVDAVAASVCDEQRIEAVFSEYKPHLVFHAAAHKHVPLMEKQPGEAIWNNSFGTMFCAQTASRHGCQKFVLVSTDKAVDPANVMGASKRIAEMLIGELQHAPENHTRFSAVRFGNVLGSSGSVVPIFRHQIAVGGPVTVTHPEAERFFMSIPEAVGLILQSAVFSEGGEIFVLDMGAPVKIRELARQMIQLHGFVPDRDIAIVYTGLRPGEKLRETTMHQTEGVADGPHPKIRKLLPTIRKNDLIHALEENRWRIHFSTPEEVRRWILDHIADASLAGDLLVRANAADSMGIGSVEAGSLGGCA